MNEVIKHAPVIVLIACGIWAMSYGIRYNLIQHKLIRRIQRVAADEGNEWVFYGDINEKLKLLFKPKTLINDSDSEAVANEKQKLIDHRLRLRHYLFRAWLIMAIPFVLVLMMFLWAVLLHLFSQTNAL